MRRLMQPDLDAAVALVHNGSVQPEPVRPLRHLLFRNVSLVTPCANIRSVRPRALLCKPSAFMAEITGGMILAAKTFPLPTAYL